LGINWGIRLIRGEGKKKQEAREDQKPEGL